MDTLILQRMKRAWPGNLDQVRIDVRLRTASRRTRLRSASYGLIVRHVRILCRLLVLKTLRDSASKKLTDHRIALGSIRPILFHDVQRAALD